MFVSKLKRQYFTYFCFALGLGISNIVESFQELDFRRLIVNVVMVLVFASYFIALAFVLGCS